MRSLKPEGQGGQVVAAWTGGYQGRTFASATCSFYQDNGEYIQKAGDMTLSVQFTHFGRLLDWLIGAL